MTRASKKRQSLRGTRAAATVAGLRGDRCVVTVAALIQRASPLGMLRAGNNGAQRARPSGIEGAGVPACAAKVFEGRGRPGRSWRAAFQLDSFRVEEANATVS